MHLHIGKNNVIGRALIRKGSVDVVSNDELLAMTHGQLSKYFNVSISAFNPLLRNSISVEEDKIVDFCKKNFANDVHFIYISTARVFDPNVSANHSIYVHNKKKIESSFKDHFDKFSCLYLPNIIPMVIEDCSLFVDQFLTNLQNKLVSFDCDEKSFWNFINPDMLGNLILSFQECVGDKLVISEKNVYVKDLIDFAKCIFPSQDLTIKLGHERKQYPQILSSSPEILYLNDVGLSWLTDRRKLLIK